MTALRCTINGRPVTDDVPARLSLADYLRERRGLTGTHVGCEQGVCGACTVLVDGRSMRACLMLAVQADGGDVRTVEGLAEPGRPWHPLQAAFDRNDALQCGFCTPGFLMAGAELLERPRLTEPDVRAALSGNLCRCTGYEGIVRSVLEVHAATARRPEPGPPAARRRPFDDLVRRRRPVTAVTVAALTAVAAVAILILRHRRRTH
jgi:carbon-monoxide dehydrogenase small subunit